LCDRTDFNDLTRATAAHFGLREELVIKDYWVTRGLLAISEADSLRGRVLFKGGTSLSKGFGLLERFSEDIDLLLTGDEFGPVPDEKERKKVLKAINEVVAGGTGLDCPHERFQGDDRQFWLVRRPHHAVYRYLLPGKNAVVTAPASDWIKVEPGYRGGPQPHVTRPLRSLCAEFLDQQRDEVRLQFEECDSDVAPFDMELLAPSRTFAEKLLALHAGVNSDRVEPRHYYDITRLYTHAEVETALRDGSFAATVRSAIEVSNTYYGAELELGLDLRASPALNLTDDLQRIIRAKYESEAHLYFRGQPRFEEILTGVQAVRDRLPPPGDTP
jgi:predicted nucleotidyltransferase component of viral defense system